MNRFFLAAILTAAFLPFVGTGGLPGEDKKSSSQPVVPKDKEPRFAKRWVYASFNLLVDDSADQVVKLIERAGKNGFNGLVLADFKLNILERLPKRYAQNMARVQQAAEKAGIEIIPSVCPIGYSEGLLLHDPNLAEGVPVKDAPFLVKKGRAVLESAVRLRNGNLEDVKGDRFVGFSYQDDPGKSTYADRQVVHQGKVSCRMEQLGKHNPAGNSRLVQRVQVRPFGCYRFSAWVKTQDVKPASGFRLLALGTREKPLPLTFFDESAVKPTSDWKKVEVVFNSLEEKEVSLFAGIWGGRSGTLWIADLQLEEISLTNVLRREGCPLVVASADGKTTYVEGKDFLPVHDPSFEKRPGTYTYDHAGPEIRLTPDSRIAEGEKLHVSWYHPILTHSYQVTCCLSDPKVYDILRDQVRRVNELLKPKTFFMSHDEIRVANWCQTCQAQKKTPGELLAENVRRCVRIIQETNPQAEIVVWSDMFDPNHNAVERYYLVNGSLTHSWDGLPRSVQLANWNSGKAAQSLKWFADRGHEQIIAGYYDNNNLEGLQQWLREAKGLPGVHGFMYTTWTHNYDMLEAYGKVLSGKE